MKTSDLQISIPEPCNKAWNKMSNVNGGRHCNLCNKTVVDLTNKNSSEIIEYVLKSKTPVCGRVDSLNVSRHHFNQSLFKKLSLSIIAFLGFNSLFSNNELKAQNIVHTKGRVSVAEENDTARITIKGIVLEKNTRRPIDFASITLEKNGRVLSAVLTDDNGSFSIHLPIDKDTTGSLTIKCSNIGYKNLLIKNIPANQDADVTITLDESSDMVMIGLITIKKPTLISPNGVGGKTFNSEELKRMGY
jgi:hypothetical protein